MATWKLSPEPRLAPRYDPYVQARCRVDQLRRLGHSVDKGYGTLLMEEAERIATTEHGSKKLAVISGIGTRQYYRKLGYELEGAYMTKILKT
eukprot:SM000045S16289  [mRNA]  locus=s45:629288:631273:- [translate_table: standard]